MNKLNRVVKFIPYFEAVDGPKFMLVMKSMKKRYFKLPEGYVNGDEDGRPEVTIERKMRKYGYEGPIGKISGIESAEVWKVDENAKIPVVINSIDLYSVELSDSDVHRYLTSNSFLKTFDYDSASTRIQLADEADWFRHFCRSMYNVPSYVTMTGKLITKLSKSSSDAIRKGAGHIYNSQAKV